jgi:hypothetical protein
MIMPKTHPPTLHIGGSEKPYLCDAERTESWPEKYLDDAVARTLEVCEFCLDIYESKRGSEAKERLLARLSDTSAPPAATDTESVSESESSPIESPVSDYVGEAKTLRQYLES